MIYKRGQQLLFYRRWLLLTRIYHPQNPHVSPPVLFYRSCRESDPSFCQSRHALKQSMWLVWLHNSFMFIWNQQGFHMGPCKKKLEAPRKQSKPKENLEQHNIRRQHLHWPQQWPCFIVYAGVRPCHFIDPGFAKPACVTPKTRICHPQSPHVSPSMPFYRSYISEAKKARGKSKSSIMPVGNQIFDFLLLSQELRRSPPVRSKLSHLVLRCCSLKKIT